MTVDLPLMPKATAVWLVENTTMTFEQIAHLCGMHPLEVQGIADGEVAGGIIGLDPVASGQLTREEVEKCEKDPSHMPQMAKGAHRYIQAKQKGARYTPVARRQDKPDALAWLLKNHPELSDAQLVKLIGTTKKTIESVREKTHWNAQNLKPRDPVLLGLCTQTDLHKAVERARLEGGKPASAVQQQG